MLKRKNKLLIVLLVSLFLITGCNKKTDAFILKKEYESLNDSLIKVSISDSNPFEIINQNEIEILINSKESFAVFYASSSNENSRNMIEPIIKVSKEVGLNKVYYVSTKDIDKIIISDELSIDNSETMLIGYIDGKISKSLNALVDNQLFDLLNEVSVKLNTCNIEVGC